MNVKTQREEQGGWTILPKKPIFSYICNWQILLVLTAYKETFIKKLLISWIKELTLIRIALSYKLTGLRIAVEHRTMSRTSDNVQPKSKIVRPNAKHIEHSVRREKFEAKLNVQPDYACLTMHWRCPSKLLIFSDRCLSYKSFLINKLQYRK